MMRIVMVKSLRVRMFRNILDSGEVAVDEHVTCLVGKNESGKTALLSALYRLNPVYNDGFDLRKDYPRWRLSQDRRDGDPSTVEAVTCVFELDDDDVHHVESLLGPRVLTSRDFTLGRRYDGKVTTDVGVDPAAAKEALFEALDTPTALREACTATYGIAGLETQAKALVVEEESGYTAEDVSEVLKGAAARLGGSETTEARVVELLRARVPKFFYFAEYQTLPGRIDLTELDGDEAPGASGRQTARALLQLASTTSAALQEEDFEERKAELEAVSNELTQEVFEYWRQNTELSVEIDLDKTTESSPYGQTAVARYLEVRVKDRRHGFTNNFGQRSSGFQWFFSFLTAFSEFKSHEHGVVVLLDEPALTLHGRAQADFLRFVEERLAPSAQVLYTTHSPFMVEPAHLERVRVVEDRGPKDGAVVTAEVMTVGEESLFPLEAALGYDIAQNLFVGNDNLLVEGTSDFTYLTVLSDHLADTGRTHLDPRWRVLPAGGATNIPTFVALVGKALQVSVLIDGNGPGVAKLSALSDRGLLQRQRLLITDAFTDGIKPSDIEDLFAPEDYLKLYNAAFTTSMEIKDLNGSDRIVARISRATKAPFVDHGKPADALLRQRDHLLPGLSAITLSRFEQLFQTINTTLT